jgi:hypothetical protein
METERNIQRRFGEQQHTHGGIFGHYVEGALHHTTMREHQRKAERTHHRRTAIKNVVIVWGVDIRVDTSVTLSL